LPTKCRQAHHKCGQGYRVPVKPGFNARERKAAVQANFISPISCLRIRDHVTVSAFCAVHCQRVDQFSDVFAYWNTAFNERFAPCVDSRICVVCAASKRRLIDLPHHTYSIPSMVRSAMWDSGRVKNSLLMSPPKLRDVKSLNTCTLIGVLRPCDDRAGICNMLLCPSRSPRSDRPLGRLEVRGRAGVYWLVACCQRFSWTVSTLPLSIQLDGYRLVSALCACARNVSWPGGYCLGPRFQQPRIRKPWRSLSMFALSSTLCPRAIACGPVLIAAIRGRCTRLVPLEIVRDSDQDRQDLPDPRLNAGPWAIQPLIPPLRGTPVRGLTTLPACVPC